MRPDHNISCDEHCYREPHLLMYVYCRHLLVSGCVWDGVKQGCNNLKADNTEVFDKSSHHQRQLATTAMFVEDVALHCRQSMTFGFSI